MAHSPHSRPMVLHNCLSIDTWICGSMGLWPWVHASAISWKPSFKPGYLQCFPYLCVLDLFCPRHLSGIIQNCTRFPQKPLLLCPNMPTASDNYARELTARELTLSVCAICSTSWILWHWTRISDAVRCWYRIFYSREQWNYGPT